MTIREYAKVHNFKIVGKLKRVAEWERTKCERWYVDEANNEYMKNRNRVAIVTVDGGII